MSKIVLAIAVIFMMMATGMLASAAADKEVAKEIALSEKSVAKGDEIAPAAISEQVIKKNAAGKEYIIRAWGRSGPVSLPQGYTGWRRIYFGGYYFLGSPIVTDSMNIGFPRGAVYSLGTDMGYTGTRSFDARLTAWAGNVYGYIDWVATRG